MKGIPARYFKMISLKFHDDWCKEISTLPRGDFFEFSGTYAGGEEGKKTVQKNIILIILDTRLIWKSNLN